MELRLTLCDKKCRAYPRFSGLDHNDVSPLYQTLTSEGSNEENVPPGQIRRPGRNNPSCGPNVVILVGVRTHWNVINPSHWLILVSQRWFLSPKWLRDPGDRLFMSGLGTPSLESSAPALAVCQQRSSCVALTWKHHSRRSAERKVCLFSIWSIQRCLSQACRVGSADRSLCVCDFQPRQAQLKASANPLGNSTLFSKSDLTYQMAHCCQTACLSFNCSLHVFYLNRCIKCIQHRYRNLKHQVHLPATQGSVTGLSLSENGVREGICVRAPPICFQCMHSC